MTAVDEYELDHAGELGLVEQLSGGVGGSEWGDGEARFLGSVLS
jgi:hypothetical protein